MTPAQKRLYALHGHDLREGRTSIRELAREAGVTYHQARAVAQAAEAHPPAGVWRVVVVGDAHFDPFEGGIDRAGLFARFVNHQAEQAMALGEKFAVVVIGDWDEMSGASSYDKGKASGELKRIRESINFANEAIRLFSEGISREAWEYMAVPPRVTLGNHEERVARVMNDHPELQGIFGMGLPGETAPIRYAWDTFGWEVVPFLTPTLIEDVAFMHYLPNPKNGRAVASVNQARALVLKALSSVVVGHSHEFDVDSMPTLAGHKLVGCVVGCAFEHEHAWRGPFPNSSADRGLTVLRNLRGSEFDAHFHPFPAIRRLLNVPEL